MNDLRDLRLQIKVVFAARLRRDGGCRQCAVRLVAAGGDRVDMLDHAGIIVGLHQTELGAEVGISQHGISDYECGKTSIPIDDAAAIAAVLEFSLDEATKLTKREGALYPSADEWELIDLFREIPEKNRREVIEIVRLTKKMVNGKKI